PLTVISMVFAVVVIGSCQGLSYTSRKLQPARFRKRRRASRVFGIACRLNVLSRNRFVVAGVWFSIDHYLLSAAGTDSLTVAARLMRGSVSRARFCGARLSSPAHYIAISGGSSFAPAHQHARVKQPA